MRSWKPLDGATEILIVGPGHAKLELIKHIHSHDHGVVDKVVGVETVDHPSDAQLVAYARKYFVAKDRMLAALSLTRRLAFWGVAWTGLTLAEDESVHASAVNSAPAFGWCFCNSLKRINK